MLISELMPFREFGHNCSVAHALEIIGERWTLLIVRDLLSGFHRFEEMQYHLKVASNILTDRLATLVEHEIIRKVPIEREAGRSEYRLTRKGAELSGVVIAIKEWGDRWTTGPEGPTRLLQHTACGHTIEPVITCSHCTEKLEPHELKTVPGPGADEYAKAMGVRP